ncbi:replication initiation factor domain-containing protein [Hymenobacter sp. ASUV-10]|uniref:Replication initiation factor domain-containing protein n=1 Tax=Hymenobacter aranciens TaxID=3063996 RepID=A0ABT9BAF2_9BACT|nr:replication initiation factor domain-containing protein [Hymenobacter sp. ASUV-10]MDO7873671.1 replication initiation factor domain-containing protein [Hymenobacter sp. ASUV-10]
MLDIMCRGHIESGSDEALHIEKGDGVLLEWTGKGTPMMRDSFNVYLWGEKFGTLHANPRSEGKGLKPDSVQVHVDNALLYTDHWYEDLQTVVQACGLHVKNVTRLDIALDGLNYIIEFLNLYQKQFEWNKTVHHKGKARFTAGVLDKRTMLYDHFKIGSGSSEKQISVYNKTKELERSNKTYIAKYWQANGLQDGGLDCPVYRVELRMRGKAVKEVKDFAIHKLTDYSYLFDLFRTGCHNYFEFTETQGHQNVSRQKPIDLIPFDALGARLLEKVPRALSDGRYKAKMAVHLTVKDIVLDLIPDDSRPQALGVMKEQIERYDLYPWMARRLPDWLKHYGKLADRRGMPNGGGRAGHCGLMDILKGYAPPPN